MKYDEALEIVENMAQSIKEKIEYENSKTLFIVLINNIVTYIAFFIFK